MTTPLFSDRILATLLPEATLELPPVSSTPGGVEEFGDLVSRGHGNPFFKGLLKAIGYNRLILDCGCGIGQLTNYLQLNNNHVLGIDCDAAALAVGLEHKLHNQLTRSAFAHMDIFHLAIRDQSYDVVIALDVLHYTHDARRAFALMARKLKPGGVILVGLHNHFARIPAWFAPTGLPRRQTTSHSIDEVLIWFQENNLEYLNCSPPILDTDGEESADLFAQTQPGNAFLRIITQLSWRKGRLFNMAGRSKQ